MFTRSFYVLRSQKQKKPIRKSSFVALSGSVCVKAVRNHVDEIDPLDLIRLIASNGVEHYATERSSGYERKGRGET